MLNLFQRRKNQSEKPSNPFLDPRLIDHSIGDRADRNAAGWRSATFTALAVVLALVIGIVVLATSRRDVISVFRENHAGVVSYVGQASENAPPSSIYGVEKALADWIVCVREIPNGDPMLVRRDGDCAFTLVQPGSQAYNELYAEFSQYPPLKLNTDKKVHRDVEAVQVNAETQLSYAISWVEYIYRDGSLVNTVPSSANVTLSALPSPPDNPNVARINPEGISISTIDPHWSDL